MCVSDSPLPPFTTGYRRQLAGLHGELSKRHAVRLLGYRTPEQRSNPHAESEMRIVPYRRPGALANARDVGAAMLTGQPIRAGRYCRGLRAALREELDRFKPDVVHVGPGKLAGLLPELRGLPAVLGVMDAWHSNVEARALTATGLRRWAFRTDIQRVQRFEATMYHQWDRVVPSNQDDLEAMRALDPRINFTLIPIGFDASAFAPDPGATVDPDRIVFHGALDYAPNVLCAEYLAHRVLPLVRARHPKAYLALVGRTPAPRVMALGELEGVHVVGPVDDLRAELTRSRVWCGPFEHGTGIKTKLLEAMATDLPAVVTPTGGRGLDLASGALLVGSTAEELADHVVRLLEDENLARRIGRAGGEYVRGRYDWPVVGRSFEELYGEVIHAKAGHNGAHALAR
jgi:glycosyltransferase involved in cell wall biosynthesis